MSEKRSRQSRLSDLAADRPRMAGKDPAPEEDEVDPKNRDQRDCRGERLREASELVQGGGGGHIPGDPTVVSEFDSDEERREAWLAHREKLLEEHSTWADSFAEDRYGGKR
jgi:hypothetical protein